MGMVVLHACDFPGCHVVEELWQGTGKSLQVLGWMTFEAPWMCYERFSFCPAHKKAIEAKHRENKERFHASR